MQFNIRNMPQELHIRLKIHAASNQTTMEATALDAIRSHLDAMPGRQTAATAAAHSMRGTV
jgi:plasmid stability protein